MAQSNIERLARLRQMTATGEARRRRLAARMALGDVGKACGVDGGTVWKWETGTRRPRSSEAAIRYLTVLDKLAALEPTAAEVAS